MCVRVSQKSPHQFERHMNLLWIVFVEKFAHVGVVMLELYKIEEKVYRSSIH